MKYIKFLLVPLLFVSLAFMNIGGCGGSDGDNNNGTVQPTNPPPVDPTPPPVDPTPPPVGPTPPPPSGTCQIPALNTNFSTTGYFFFDPVLGITIGVTSDGATVAIVLIDSQGVSIGAVAFPLGAFACEIDLGVIGDAVFNASGICGRSDDATLFLVADFFIENVEFVDLSIGECFDVRALNPATVSQQNVGAKDLEAIAQSVHKEIMETRELEAEPFSLENFNNTLQELE